MVEAAQLEQPLDPALDYFDATPLIEQLAEKMLELLQAMQIQAKINRRIAENQQLIFERLAALEQPKSNLILPERMQ